MKKRARKSVQEASANLRRGAVCGEVDRVCAAIAAGADVNSFRAPSETGAQASSLQSVPCALHLTASSPRPSIYHAECARLLLDNGAIVDLTDQWGCTALMLRHKDSSSELLKLLLERGANVNHRSHHYGFTPLDCASKWWKAEDLAILLRAGADVRGKDGTSYLMKAVSANRLDNVSVLLDAGAQFDSSLLFHARNVESVSFLFEHGADPRVRNGDGLTPFQDQPYPEHLCAVYENWTPFCMLPSWNTSVLNMYVDHCPGFKRAIKTLLLCLLRFQRWIYRDLRMQIIAHVADGHRQECWWPIEDFSMEPFMCNAPLIGTHELDDFWLPSLGSGSEEEAMY